MIDEVRLAFGALREANGPTGADLAIRAMPTAPSALLALDATENPHLLILSNETDLKPSGAAAIEVSGRSLVVNGRTQNYVDVACVIPPLAEIFDHLIVAILERTSDPRESPSVAVAGIVEEWKQLLAAPGPGPSRDKLVGILGELVVLVDVVRADPSRRADAWVGPFGGRHDIRRGDHAIEVKTTRAHTARVVTIHGEDQLLEPEGGDLHLHLVRLEEVPSSGRSVPDLVDELIAAGASPREVFQAVESAGLPPADYPAAAAITFDVRERFTVRIDGQSPRIVPATFASGERPAGVVDLTYRIDLDHSVNRALTTAEYDDLITGIATFE